MQVSGIIRVTIVTTSFSLLASGSFAANQSNQLDRELRQMFPSHLPGAAVLVQKKGVTLLNKGYGLANVELQVPIRAGQVFYAASVGKQFTAAAIMKLVEQNKLSLQAPIRQYFPHTPESWSGITVEQLLHHTSGIANIFSDAEFSRHAFEAHTPQQMLEQAAAMPLLSVPGAAFNYSSVNYTLLAMLIEQLCGCRYDQYLAQQLFQPVGMRQTYFVQNAGLIRGLATPYQQGPRLAVRWNDSLLLGGGSYATTNADLALWTKALQGGKVLQPDSLRAMNQPLVLPDGTRIPYGYGIRPHTLAGQPYLRSSGDIQGFHAEVVYLPQSKVLVSILSNSEDAPRFGLLPAARRLAMIAAGLPIQKVSAKKLPEHELQQHVGVYKHGEERYTFKVEHGQLMVQEPGNAGWVALQPLSSNEFYYAANSEFRIRFRLDGEGNRTSQWYETDPLDDYTDPIFKQ